MKKRAIISDEAEFFRKVTNPTQRIVDWHILNEEMVQIEYEYRDEFTPENMQSNIILATFTTAHARLRLFDVLHKLGESVLYFDIIYKSSTGKDLVTTDVFLGDLTDELDGHHIVEFVSAGPKNYGYKLENGQCFCKVKGFTLNHKVSQILNFEKMKEEVQVWYNHQGSTNTVVSYTNRIRRDPLKQQIFNKDETKKYRVVYTKTALAEDYNTLSYGF